MKTVRPAGRRIGASWNGDRIFLRFKIFHINRGSNFFWFWPARRTEIGSSKAIIFRACSRASHSRTGPIPWDRDTSVRLVFCMPLRWLQSASERPVLHPAPGGESPLSAVFAASRASLATRESQKNFTSLRRFIFDKFYIFSAHFKASTRILSVFHARVSLFAARRCSEREIYPCRGTIGARILSIDLKSRRSVNDTPNAQFRPVIREVIAKWRPKRDARKSALSLYCFFSNRYERASNLRPRS